MAHPPMPETAPEFQVATLEDVAELRRALLDVGFDRRKVAGCVDWVVAMATGQPGTETPNRLSAYRKMLRVLLAEQGRPWPPPRARRGQAAPEAAPAAAERGAARVGALVAVAACAVTALYGPVAPVEARAPIRPVIRRRDGSEGQKAA